MRRIDGARDRGDRKTRAGGNVLDRRGHRELRKALKTFTSTRKLSGRNVSSA
jgi:hypothetical protein